MEREILLKNASKILTYKPDPKDDRDYKFGSTVKGPIESTLLKAPGVISHRKKMTSVKDQGNLGSCVGFAVTAMKEWQEKTEHEAEVAAGKVDFREGKEYNLSEAWVYWNAKKIDPWPNEEGTSIRFAMKVLQKLGTPSEGGWEYSDKFKGEPESWATLIARWARIDSYWRVDNLSELKLALLDGPIVMGIPCFREFFYAGLNGVVPYPANPDEIYGGHALCVIGYDDSKQRVMFKNSWGEEWGNYGYGSVPYQYINDFLWDAWACKDLSMTKELLKESKSLFDL